MEGWYEISKCEGRIVNTHNHQLDKLYDMTDLVTIVGVSVETVKIVGNLPTLNKK